MTSEYAIRPMRMNDANRLSIIVALSFSRLMGFFALQSLFSSKGQVLVCEAQGNVAGFAKLIDFEIAHEKFGCLLWLAVLPIFRRKGVASELTAEGIRLLKQDGAKAVFASAQRRKTGTLIVLERSGFRKAGLLELSQLFGWRILEFYRDIWLAPGEVVLMHD